MSEESNLQENELFDRIWAKYSKLLAEQGPADGSKLTKNWTRDKSFVLFWIKADIHLQTKIARLISPLREMYSSHHYFEEGHITLKSCGLLGEEVKDRDMPEIINIANEVFANFRPFSVNLKGFNVFPTTFFVQVYDLQGFLHKMHNHLRRSLGSLVRQYEEFEGLNYIPHLTVGRFRNDGNISLMLDTLQDMRNTVVADYNIRHIELVSSYGYEPGSKWQTIRIFDLGQEK